MAAAWWRKFCNFKRCSFLVLKPNHIGSFQFNLRGKGTMCSATKPYAFHPRTRTLEGEDQVLYLTKTIVMGEVPVCYHNNYIDKELMDRYRQCIVQTRLFNYEGERSTKTTCAMPLMLNMLKVLWSQGTRFPGLHDLSLSYKPHVSAVWKRHDEHIQVSGNLGFLLSTKQPLVTFASESEVKDTEYHSLSSLDLIAPVFDLQQVASNARTDTGFYAGSPYPHAHTLVIVNTENNWSVKDRCAQGLMFTFGRLVAQATNHHGYKIGEALKQPLSAQCVISDGFRLSFIFFQLNTLEFCSDEGTKNMAWILPGVQMYSKAWLENAVCEAKVEDFNEDCFELFTKMMVNGVEG